MGLRRACGVAGVVFATRVRMAGRSSGSKIPGAGYWVDLTIGGVCGGGEGRGKKEGERRQVPTSYILLHR